MLGPSTRSPVANMNVRKEEFDAQFLDWCCTQCPNDHA